MVAIMEIPYSPYLLCHSATVLPLEATLLLFYASAMLETTALLSHYNDVLSYYLPVLVVVKLYSCYLLQ